MRKKLINDEVDKHPFYSDYGIKEWKKHIKKLEEEEQTLGKRRKINGKENSSNLPEGVE